MSALAKALQKHEEEDDSEKIMPDVESELDESTDDILKSQADEEIEDDEKLYTDDDEDDDEDDKKDPDDKEKDDEYQKDEKTTQPDDSSLDDDDEDDSLVDDDNFDNNGDSLEKQRRLRRAERHYQNSMRLSQQKLYVQAIEEHKKSLALRESLIGRYHKDTANVYGEVGDAYYMQGDYEKAIVAHNAWLRIERRASGCFDKPAIDSWTRESLKKMGMEEGKVDLYDSNINISLQHERDGDSFRERGQYKLAINEYKEAITVSMGWIGNEIAIGFLWRKIAFLLGKEGKKSEDSDDEWESDKIEETEKIDWEDADRLDVKEEKENTYGLLEMVYQSIQQGDVLHGQAEYKESLETYRIACDIAEEDSDDKKNDEVGTLSQSIHDMVVAASDHNSKRLTASDAVGGPAGPILRDIVGRLDKLHKSQDNLGETLEDGIGQMKYDIAEQLFKTLKETRTDLTTPLVAIVQSQGDMFRRMERMELSHMKLLDEANKRIDEMEEKLLEKVSSKLEDIESNMTYQINNKMGTIMDQLEKLNDNIADGSGSNSSKGCWFFK